MSGRRWDHAATLMSATYTRLVNVAVLVVILTVVEGELRVLLIHRSGEPAWAPGRFRADFLRAGSRWQTPPPASWSKRPASATSTSSSCSPSTASMTGTQGSVAVSYFALVDTRRVRLRDEPAWEPRWYPVSDLPTLAFNNERVMDYAVERLRNKLQYTNVAYSLMAQSFPLSELQAVYESIFGRRFDKRNFRRRMLSQGILRPTGKTVARGAGPPR